MKTTAFILVGWFCIICANTLQFNIKYRKRGRGRNATSILYRLKFKMGKNPKHSILNTTTSEQQRKKIIMIFRTVESKTFAIHRLIYLRAANFTSGKMKTRINCMCGNRFILIQMHFDMDLDSFHPTRISLSAWISSIAVCLWSRVMWSTVNWCNNNNNKKKHASYIKIQAEQQADKRYFLFGLWS